MSTPLNATVKLRDPRDVLAAIPHLLGFTPADSLVLILVHDSHVSPRFGLTMRVDLPPPGREQAIADHLKTGPCGAQEADGALAVVVGQHPATRDTGRERPLPRNGSTVDRLAIPHWNLVAALRGSLWDIGIDVLHASWAPEIRDGGPWWCYEDDECRGVMFDPKASQVGAAMAAAGAVTFESREKLEELVAPDPPDVLARRTAKLDAMTEDMLDERGTGLGTRRDLQTVFNAIQRTAEGAALTEDDHLRVLLALSDTRVRDMALGSALSAHARAAEQLWLTLVRKAPPPEVAEVASLLAFSAYFRGEGALASVALDRIEDTRPDHRLGNLLRAAMERGIPGADLEVIAKDAAEDARITIEEDGDWS